MSALRVRDYKSYSRATSLPLRRLTVLLGKNNSGKTAAARLPMLLLAAASRRSSASSPPIPLRIQGMTFASTALELVYRQAPHGTFDLGYSYTDHHGQHTDIDFTVQIVQGLKVGPSAFISQFRASCLPEEATWTKQQSPSGKIEYGPGIAGFDGIYPIFNDPEMRARTDVLRSEAEASFTELLHLTSIRAPLLSVYENRPSEAPIDNSGAEVPYLLNEDPHLLRLVASWYARELGLEDLQLEVEAAAFRLTAGSVRGPSHNLARAGQGVQQVLPIVVYLQALASGNMRQKLLVIEEPELHLHPSAHGALASLMASTLESCPDSQLIVETHSENLVLRLRYEIAKGRISPDDVNILWFDQWGDSTRVDEILIRNDGSVTDWPSGVFAEDLAEIRAIAQVGRQ